MTKDWRGRAGTQFTCEKRPVRAAKGMVVTNHPLASAAGAEMLAAGGNAVDAAIAALFTLTVVEPMMVGIVGGGTAHIRLPDGQHLVIDAMSTVPGAFRPDSFTPAHPDQPMNFESLGRLNTVGALSIATPGTLKGWDEALRRFGTLSLADVMEPAIRHASRGFAVTPYLSECIGEAAPDMLRDEAISAVWLPGGTPRKAGERVVQGDYAATLATIAREGIGALHGGAIGSIVADAIARKGGVLSAADIAGYSPVERAPIRAMYRGYEVIGPPPPSSSGVHIAQMLAILESYDVAGMGFGSADTLHLLAECLKIAFADRAAATGDPAYVKVPVEKLTSKDYAAERRAMLSMEKTQAWGPGVTPAESPNTTHLTVADGNGMIVSSTQTINSLFGSRMMIPGTGIVPNNYMALFDPRPGKALSIQPGKRITTSMSPMIVLKDGKPAFALGMPGGLRIFGSVMQAIVNVIDHGMALQEAVEAPRLWTQGGPVEVEAAIAAPLREALAARGHEVMAMPHIGGGMCAIGFDADGMMEGAACWRADGTAMGMGGGLARAGARFWPDAPRR